MNALEKLIAANYEGTMSYAEYRELVDQLLEEGKSTGPNQTDALLEYSKMNVQRMNRWDKHTKLSDETVDFFKNIKHPLHVLIITEGWCGDGAQIVPVVIKIIEQNPLIQEHIILRDEHLEIMDMFLTDGKSRSVPMFIFIDENGKVVSKFGPRPKAAIEMMDQLRAEGMDAHDVKEKLHLWYARDKHQAIEHDIIEALS
ncbi:MAG: thioredoxin family protein [Flavobacteriales bacterium]